MDCPQSKTEYRRQFIPTAYQGEFLLDSDEAPVDLPGLAEEGPPLLLDARCHLQLLPGHLDAIHPQGAVTLLDISGRVKEIQRIKWNSEGRIAT